nr:hypothetical protein [Yersinia intermedia]
KHCYWLEERGLLTVRNVSGCLVASLSSRGIDVIEGRNTVATWCEEELAPLLTLLDPDIRHSVGGDFARIADLSIFSVSSIEQDT